MIYYRWRELDHSGYWRSRFRVFWGGVAGWPKQGRHQAAPCATRYLLAKGHIPDFAEGLDGHIHLTARRRVESATTPALHYTP